MIDEAIEVAGALLVLAAFLGLQRRRLAPRSLLYIVLNLVGSGILTTVALADGDWGFLLLQGVWAIVSLWSLIRVLSGKEPAPAHY